jgi:hypothetical protein
MNYEEFHGKEKAPREDEGKSGRQERGEEKEEVAIKMGGSSGISGETERAARPSKAASRLFIRNT